MRICQGCGEEINPKRIEILPSTTTCVKCSTVEKKGGIIVTLGEKDHTCNELVIMDRDKIDSYSKNAKKSVKKILSRSERDLSKDAEG